MTNTETSSDLVERLEPKWAVDEEVSRAISNPDLLARRDALSAFLVANNDLKREAVAEIERLTAEVARLSALNARQGEALSKIVLAWNAAINGNPTKIAEITGWTGSLDNYGQIFAWVAALATESSR